MYIKCLDWIALSSCLILVEFVSIELNWLVCNLQGESGAPGENGVAGVMVSLFIFDLLLLFLVCQINLLDCYVSVSLKDWNNPTPHPHYFPGPSWSAWWERPSWICWTCCKCLGQSKPFISHFHFPLIYITDWMSWITLYKSLTYSALYHRVTYVTSTCSKVLMFMLYTSS